VELVLPVRPVMKDHKEYKVYKVHADQKVSLVLKVM
jgi:hypothetical protein